MTEVDELRRTAKFNRKHRVNQTIISNIDNSKYSLKICWISAKGIKLELFLDWDDILKYHNHKHLENVLYNKINTVYPKKKKGTVWRSQ